MEIKQSSTTPLLFLLVDSTDLKTPEPSLSPTVVISKDGAAFASPAGTISEVGNGIYKLTPTSADTNTLRSLVLHATATGAHCTPMLYEVVSHTRAEVMAALSSVLSAIASLFNVSASEIRDALAVELARIDVAVSTRNATAPDNAAIAAIQAKTDNLPADPAATADIPTIEAIIGAAGGLTSETVAKLEAATDILLAAPYVPTESPVLIIPTPDEDDTLSTVFVYTESITNIKRAGISLTFKLASVPAKSERMLEVAPKPAVTDPDGFASITLQRGLEYEVSSNDLGLKKRKFTPSGPTFDLITLLQ